jgi:hypothetical protein
VRATHGNACQRRIRAAARSDSAESGRDTTQGRGWQVVPTCHRRRARESRVWLSAVRKLGRLGRTAVLGCDAVHQAEEKEVRRRTSS